MTDQTPAQLWSAEKLAEMAGKTCDDCAEHIARWGQDYPALKDEALHIAVGVAMGSWACDHVDWDDQDAARAYEALYASEMRWRNRLRADNERLRRLIGEAYMQRSPHPATALRTLFREANRGS